MNVYDKMMLLYYCFTNITRDNKGICSWDIHKILMGYCHGIYPLVSSNVATWEIMCLDGGCAVDMLLSKAI
jgi:uncharacterized membrane protein